jgi:hypothetical protein
LLVPILVDGSPVGSEYVVRGLLIGELMLSCDCECEHGWLERIPCLQSINSMNEGQLRDEGYYKESHTSDPPVGPKNRDMP